MEQWRPVAGFEGLYEVSSLGRVKRLPVPRYCGGGRYAKTPERSSFGHVDVRGYMMVSLGRGKRTYVHRLVCEAFHGPPPKDKPYTAHFDGDKKNNRADNLRWTSAKENNGHDARRLGSTCAGERAWKARLTAADVRKIRKEYEPIAGQWGAQSLIARRHGLLRGHVAAIVKRKLWTHIE